MNLRRYLAWALLLLTSLGGRQLAAHEMPFAAVFLDATNPARAVLRVELDLVDLAALLPLDIDQDSQVTFGEYRRNKPVIDTYVIDHLQLAADGVNCPLAARVNDSGIRPGAAPKSVTEFALACPLRPDTDSIQVNSSLLTGLDPDYRSLLEIARSGSRTSILLANGTTHVSLHRDDRSTRLLSYVAEGFHHILIGADHLAFLLLLLLPVARNGTFRGRFLGIAGIVTAFTLAHSVILLLAVGGLVSVQAYWVEIMIAGSVIFAGLLNVIRPAHRLGWSLAYAFGLVHGFGFASALAELLGADGFSIANVLAFNVGVELGQLGVVAVSFPLLSFLGPRERYQRVFVPVMSAGVALLGASWLWARL